MCGIIGYSGHRPACGVIVEGLQRLEYRGYDSAGILVNENGSFVTVKREGRLENLKKALQGCTLTGSCGMGHTRWATHGSPTDANAHPHGTQRVMLIHNGIIENHLEIKAFLSEKGYGFTSETDTEAAACYLDYCYHGDPMEAIRALLKCIKGAYALLMMFSDRPDEIYAVRKDGPLLAAPGDGENLLVSDITASVGYTDRYFVIEEGEIAKLTSEYIKVFDSDGCEVQKSVSVVNWGIEQAQREGYPHFMLKEINEQPEAIRRTISGRISDGLPDFSADGIPRGFFSRFSSIKIAACGTAMHAGLIGKALIEKLAGITVEVEAASEFRCREHILTRNDLVMVISQSGETADTLAALRLARQHKAPTLAIVNAAGSSIARDADYVIHTCAGPEISVASTKAYSVQLAVLYLIAFSAAHDKGCIDKAEAKRLTDCLCGVPEAIRAALKLESRIKAAAEKLKDSENIFFIGRGMDLALCCEGSLKLKEISYIHSEACGAGELKHGTISLIDKGVPVVALSTQSTLAPKMLSNIREVKARGAWVLLFSSHSSGVSTDEADCLIPLDVTDDMFSAFTAAAALQLLAYHTAKARGCDIDKPRNLAKSVTVE